MRIKRVRLKNYKRFTDLTIDDLPETTRLVVLVGPNGTGKSSVFDSFLLKSQAAVNNYRLSGDREQYYEKVPRSQRHCHVNWLPRDQATISSTQTWFYCRYLGAVSACDALT